MCPPSQAYDYNRRVNRQNRRLQSSKFRDRFELKQQWAVRVEDLQEALLRFSPHIVHFSGHGSNTGELLFQDGNGKPQAVSQRALSRLFSILKDNISCVVLNACFSKTQAEGIAESIDCVIGMSRAISDPSAISFAAAFYQGLGYGRSIKNSFDLGCSQIDLEGLSEENTPKLISLRVDPDTIFSRLRFNYKSTF
jgi:hypothetical protein